MLPASEQDITPATVMMSATLVRMAHPDNENLHNALSKAEVRLFTHAWEVSGGVLKIESESNVGNFRHTDGDTCDCPTRKYICWHRGAHFILSVLAAAMIAPIRSHFEPLAARPAAAAEDPASLGNFLDRPELAPEAEDVSFEELAETETPAERRARERIFECRPGSEARAARVAAYEAARATGAGYGEANLAADRALGLWRSQPEEPPPPPPKLGRRGNANDGELEYRAKLASRPHDHPIVWDTSAFADEEEESADKNAEKIVSSRKRRESPPDPFEDVL